MTTPVDDDGSSTESPAEQLQRKLVQDVAAYEVDPPAPERGTDPARE